MINVVGSEAVLRLSVGINVISGVCVPPSDKFDGASPQPHSSTFECIPAAGFRSPFSHKESK